MNRTAITTTLVSVTALGLAGTSAYAGDSFTGEAKEAWLTGRIETLYVINEHLNPFAIETTVEGETAHLTGTVDSEIARDLAEELALGIDGISEVRNDLTVSTDSLSARQTAGEGNKPRDFGTWVDDATTTAAVKSRLIRNENTKGLQIDVDTQDDVVTLSGRVDSDEERELAEQVALNSRDVTEVNNNLVVDPS